MTVNFRGPDFTMTLEDDGTLDSVISVKWDTCGCSYTERFLDLERADTGEILAREWDWVRDSFKLEGCTHCQPD